VFDCEGGELIRNYELGIRNESSLNGGDFLFCIGSGLQIPTSVEWKR
jgi:hypothetical protein